MLKKLFFAWILMITIGLQGFSQIGTQNNNQTPRDGAWDRLRHEEKRPIEYAYVREADVLWHKRVWQEIDLRKRMNQPMFFPQRPTENMRSLMQVIMDGLQEGDITAYHAEAEDFSREVSYADLMSGLTSTRQVTLRRPEPPHEEYDTVFTDPFDPTNVVKFRIKEDWFFDAKRSVLDVRVIGICPVRETYRVVPGVLEPDSMIYLGDEPLFWIYFPEARDVFVNAPVFNRRNDAQRLSYDDLFVRRFFDGTIYKASNVQDRRISEFHDNPLDALFEAQRIKELIRNFEHDLWEF